MTNILCIDWEYFIGATAKQRAMMFPDSGNEISVEGQLLIWKRCYEQSFINKELLGEASIYDMSTLGSEIIDLHSLVEKYKKPDTKVYVREYPVEIDKIITGGVVPKGSSINVCKIGFSHDCNNIKLDKVISGNWGRTLRYEKAIHRFSWVRRNDSNDTDSEIIDCTYDNIYELLENPDKLSSGIDYIFICRSGMWTPPNLDSDYVEVIERLADLIGRDNVDGLDKAASRWTDEFKEHVKKSLAARIVITEKFMKTNNEGKEDRAERDRADKEIIERLKKMYQENFNEPFNFTAEDLGIRF
jgi:hypothetical protein